METTIMGYIGVYIYISYELCALCVALASIAQSSCFGNFDLRLNLEEPSTQARKSKDFLMDP